MTTFLWFILALYGVGALSSLSLLAKGETTTTGPKARALALGISVGVMVWAVVLLVRQ